MAPEDFDKDYDPHSDMVEGCKFKVCISLVGMEVYLTRRAEYTIIWFGKECWHKDRGYYCYAGWNEQNGAYLHYLFWSLALTNSRRLKSLKLTRKMLLQKWTVPLQSLKTQFQRMRSRIRYVYLYSF